MIGILYVCVLMSAAGCSINVDTNIDSGDQIETAALSEHNQEEYSNPIDAYFLPYIENASCEAERRELCDNYRGVWKTEFENIMVWMQDKCVYQEDKDNLLLFTKSVESLIETTRVLYSVFIAVLFDNKLHTFVLCRIESFVIVFVCRNCNEDWGCVALYACFNQCFKIIPVVCFISEWHC